MRRAFCLLGPALMGVAFLASPASADTACVAGNFSTIAGTTCDIGLLQFTFQNISSLNYVYDLSTKSYTYYSTWTNSDFSFQPLSNGFTLRFDGGPQSVTASADSYAFEEASVDFGVHGHGVAVADLGVSGGAISGSGQTYSVGYSQGIQNVHGWYRSAFNELYQINGMLLISGPETFSGGPAIDDGGGFADIFFLSAGFPSPSTGDSATWDGTPTTFTYSTTTTFIPTPEPSSVLLLSAGLFFLVALVPRKDRESF